MSRKAYPHLLIRDASNTSQSSVQELKLLLSGNSKEIRNISNIWRNADKTDKRKKNGDVLRIRQGEGHLEKMVSKRKRWRKRKMRKKRKENEGKEKNRGKRIEREIEKKREWRRVKDKTWERILRKR